MAGIPIVKEDPKSIIFAKYEVPEIGYVQLISSPNDMKNGPYYARVEGQDVVARYSTTRLEVKLRTEEVLSEYKDEDIVLDDFKVN